MSDISGSGGGPVAGEQEGKAAPLEHGREKVLDFPLLTNHYKIRMLHEFQKQNLVNSTTSRSCQF
jgi:hypothetical protein